MAIVTLACLPASKRAGQLKQSERLLFTDGTLSALTIEQQRTTKARGNVEEKPE
jgi:hypothetical protein